MQDSPEGKVLRERYEAIEGSKKNARRAQFHIQWAEDEYRQFVDIGAQKQSLDSSF